MPGPQFRISVLFSLMLACSAAAQEGQFSEPSYPPLCEHLAARYIGPSSASCQTKLVGQGFLVERCWRIGYWREIKRRLETGELDEEQHKRLLNDQASFCDLLKRLAAGRGKIPGSTVETAKYLFDAECVSKNAERWSPPLDVADRARFTELDCFRVLAALFGRDREARRMREFYQRPENRRDPQTMQQPRVPNWDEMDDSVFDVLVEHFKGAPPESLDIYLSAVIQFRDERLHTFFADILKGETTPRPTLTSQFFAACGLILLRDSEGVDWMIAHTSDGTEILDCVARRPWLCEDDRLGSAASAVLRQLSGPYAAKPYSWQSWWNERGHVVPEDVNMLFRLDDRVFAHRKPRVPRTVVPECACQRWAQPDPQSMP
ncbi:MAG: hypothetical protein J5J06_03725 [Phycisphaerae bacterium]|nr:hypothetical protein [Phycisphaerae bacterium]